MVAKAESIGTRVHSALKARWSDLRARSVFYQARVALLAVYALVVITTLIVAPPLVEDFEMSWDQVSFGASSVTYVDFQNNDLGTLKDVTVEVRGEGVEFDGRRKKNVWTGVIRKLPEGDRTQIKPEMLKDSAGYRAPNHIDVTFVSLKSKSGKVIAQGVPPRKKTK